MKLKLLNLIMKNIKTIDIYDHNYQEHKNSKEFPHFRSNSTFADYKTISHDKIIDKVNLMKYSLRVPYKNQKHIHLSTKFNSAFISQDVRNKIYEIYHNLSMKTKRQSFTPNKNIDRLIIVKRKIKDILQEKKNIKHMPNINNLIESENYKIHIKNKEIIRNMQRRLEKNYI